MTSYAKRPVWIDLTAGDPAAASAFYGSLMNWSFPPQHPDAGGWLAAMATDGAAAGISPRPPGVEASFWNVFFGADDIEATIAYATDLGATVMMPPVPIVVDGKLMSTIAILIDPTGAAFGLAQQAASPGLQHAQGHGSVTWYELMTRDLDAGANFYASFLGGTVEPAPVDMDYRQIVLPNFGAFAGMMAMPAEVPAAVPPFWAPYFEVDDVDATTAAATAAGSTVLMPPHDMTAGRIAVLLDAEGAALNLITSPAHEHA